MWEDIRTVDNLIGCQVALQWILLNWTYEYRLYHPLGVLFRCETLSGLFWFYTMSYYVTQVFIWAGSPKLSLLMLSLFIMGFSCRIVRVLNCTGIMCTIQQPFPSLLQLSYSTRHWHFHNVGWYNTYKECTKYLATLQVESVRSEMLLLLLLGKDSVNKS